MTAPRVLILRAPGTNCDEETAYAFELAGASAERVHLNRWLESPSLAEQYQILCLPGGFSYGDDVAAGRIVASQIRNHLADTARQFVDAEKLVIGICNGFQVLIKSGILLPDIQQDGQTRQAATLTWNDSGMFEDRWVSLKSNGKQCVFLRDVERMYLPVAHAEGKFVASDAATLDRLENDGQLALAYAAPNGDNSSLVSFPHNPNGAERDVAGVCDVTGRVFGLMPHPERYITRTQHPRWTRESLSDCGDGLVIFQNAVAWFS